MNPHSKGTHLINNWGMYEPGLNNIYAKSRLLPGFRKILRGVHTSALLGKGFRRQTSKSCSNGPKREPVGELAGIVPTEWLWEHGESTKRNKSRPQEMERFALRPPPPKGACHHEDGSDGCPCQSHHKHHHHPATRDLAESPPVEGGPRWVTHGFVKWLTQAIGTRLLPVSGLQNFRQETPFAHKTKLCGTSFWILKKCQKRPLQPLIEPCLFPLHKEDSLEQRGARAPSPTSLRLDSSGAPPARETSCIHTWGLKRLKIDGCFVSRPFLTHFVRDWPDQGAWQGCTHSR